MSTNPYEVAEPAEDLEEVEIATSPEPVAGVNPPKESLRARVLNSLGWEVGGQIGMQITRFGGNILLTKLLLPEAFGVIGLAQVFLMALNLLSDVGLTASVIHHPRGKDAKFLDTVWTVSIIRGWILWGLTCLGAIPFARFYEIPELAWVLPVAGFSSVIRAFASTSILTAKRDLRNAWYVIVDCGSQMMGTILTVVLAFFIPSVAALAWGWIATAVVYTGLSFCARGVQWNWFCWDREAVQSLASFGRWAMASSGVTILQERGDRMALGKIVTAAALGNYMIGANLATLPMTIFWRIQLGIAHPFYSRIRSESAEMQHSKIRRLRLGVVSTVGPAILGLIVLGNPVVRLIYDAPYHQAGWYCQLVGLASLVRVSTDVGPIFMAYGQARIHFLITLFHATAGAVGMLIGYLIGNRLGNPAAGVLYGFAFGPLLAYPFQIAMYRRINAWFPEVDAIGLSAAALVVVAQVYGLI
ncbi:MAG: oligosaccharide flippase family protein [Planctomycetales bacterium]|nr:oligosaccharide flippase family protein [Planctomycetales bacterium]MCA9166614.1 oligosaccharide flippase family protein [Planctomycetales bacterium]